MKTLKDVQEFCISQAKYYKHQQEIDKAIEDTYCQVAFEIQKATLIKHENQNTEKDGAE